MIVIFNYYHPRDNPEYIKNAQRACPRTIQPRERFIAGLRYQAGGRQIDPYAYKVGTISARLASRREHAVQILLGHETYMPYTVIDRKWWVAA